MGFSLTIWTQAIPSNGQIDDIGNIPSITHAHPNALPLFINWRRGWIPRRCGINRYNLWGQVLGYFPRNLCMWPLLTAIVVGGMISDDRQNGTSAIYFSRPISRIDYTAMKFLSVAVILAFVIIFSYFAYYTSAIVFRAEGWAFLADTLPMFLGGILAGLALVFTYTSIGLALSSISQSRFFAAIGFLSIIYGTKLVSLLVELQFETTFLYAISPYDCLAHLGQFALGLPPNYDHPLSFSVVSLISMNVVSIWILVNRVTSLEVTPGMTLESEEPPAVVIEGVSKWYGQVIGLNDLSLAIDGGVTGVWVRMEQGSLLCSS